MKGLELLETYPKAGKIVNKWFLDKMIASLNNDAIPDEFKEYISNQPIENENISVMIDNNPRVLFDVFDDNNVFIQINVSKTFSYSINEGDVISGSWRIRKDAEAAAMEQAFALLDEKL
jgi:hypothetical protein